MQIKNFLFLFLALAVFSATAKSDGFEPDAVDATGLTTEQAQQVLIVMLKHEKFPMKKPGFYIEALNPNQPGYHDFSVAYDSPKVGATDVLGWFAVSKMTGDIWELHSCKRYAFRQLRRIQAAIMKQTRKTFASESEVTLRRGLGCTDE